MRYLEINFIEIKSGRVVSRVEVKGTVWMLFKNIISIYNIKNIARDL